MNEPTTPDELRAALKRLVKPGTVGIKTDSYGIPSTQIIKITITGHGTTMEAAVADAWHQITRANQPHLFDANG